MESQVVTWKHLAYNHKFITIYIFNFVPVTTPKYIIPPPHPFHPHPSYSNTSDWWPPLRRWLLTLPPHPRTPTHLLWSPWSRLHNLGVDLSCFQGLPVDSCLIRHGSCHCLHRNLKWGYLSGFSRIQNWFSFL